MAWNVPRQTLNLLALSMIIVRRSEISKIPKIRNSGNSKNFQFLKAQDERGNR